MPNAIVATRIHNEELQDWKLSTMMLFVDCVKEAWNTLTVSLEGVYWRKSRYALIADSFVWQKIRVFGMECGSVDFIHVTKPSKSH